MYVWKQLSPSVELHLDLGLAFGMTDTGTVRRSNEDNFLIDPSLGLIAIADGMGGHESGEIASSDALLAMAQFIRASKPREPGEDGASTLADQLAQPAQNDANFSTTDGTLSAMVTLYDAVEFANKRMYQTNVDLRRGATGMGTTLTGMWQPAPGAPVLIFHIGDTRLYRYRQGTLTLLTHDQTMYQHAVDQGFIGVMPPRNLLLQALGPACAVNPELMTQDVEPGDLFMLCSDGLHSASSDAQITTILAGASADRLGATCQDLIEQAKRDGSRDNITVVLFQCK